MQSSRNEFRWLKTTRGSAIALAAALACAGTASAQAQPAPADAPETEQADAGGEIVVTGSRVERAGFDAPTPTTVIGDVELRQGSRPSIAQVLNDQPQFRATSTPASTTGNTNSSASTADLRGLGAVRTLTLLNGRRFTGSADLNSVPMSVIKRVEVVTGGASAAWGSGAVAGVVNILLNEDLEGITLGADAGISSRGDGFRYGFNGSFGTKFADDRGHFMIAAEYVDDQGAFDRLSRPNLGAGLFSLNGRLTLQPDVNVASAAPGGLIMSGVLAGQVFNPDGSLSPFGYGSVVSPNSPTTLPTSMLGGAGRSQNDYLAVSSPYERINLFAHASYELNETAKLWIDGSFNRMESDFGFFPDVRAVSPATPTTAAAGGILIQRDNAFLSSAIRNRLIAAGQTSFRMGRFLDDIGELGILNYAYKRDNIEGAIGLDGEIGGGWKYSAYFGHGELKNRQALQNQRITANFNNAVDAVISPTTGQPICRIALTDPTTLCRPLNLLGYGNASAETVAYAFGDGGNTTVTKLDTTGFSVRGDAFSTWAGPVSVALGVEARRESIETTQVDALSRQGALGILNFSALDGSFNVKEAFAEAVVPLLDIEDTATLELNGAARYSDYSNSGGIWSWKVGATSRLFDSLLLRAVRSRDIRSPSITELFTTRTTNIQPVTDPFNGNQVVTVFRYGGGNPDLVPEIAHTTTIGGSFSPKFIPGFSLSIDYYRIDIDKVIGSLSAQDIVTQCFRGNTGLCDQIVRDSTGAITTVFATNLNLASYKTRGVDFEASYQLPLDTVGAGLPGSLRFRALATYVDTLLINDGVNTYDRAGDVGDNAAFTTPKWRGTGSITYQSEDVNVDMRMRYVGGGNYNSLQPIVNNRINSRTYFDLGAQFNIAERFTLTATVNNLFDRDPPPIAYSSAIYDVMGRYFQVGAKVRF
ncbi:TonB-dependent receptor plug domain-containing protein [Sphingomonas cavernae]|uniref:TonB-dependent receptor n=1 Tax=Sphingomonas cavernae TaxID=2320861 RepID=A0A418WSP5_9SPHN|nr:TonB-dependent receptor [Sphingomonas cavernae]RJF94217.1 TonB-dependent receptor [Sphingomonas cavernae]